MVRQGVPRCRARPPADLLGRARGTFLVDPRRIPLGLATRFPVPKSPAGAGLFRAARWLLRTDEPRARLRMTEYRGKVSATMIYDDLPVLDVFRKVDDDTLLGAMDLRGLERPLCSSG